MKIISLLLSIILHGVALAAAFTAVWAPPAVPGPTLEIDLTTLAPPPEAMVAPEAGQAAGQAETAKPKAAPIKAKPMLPKAKPSDKPSPPKIAKRPPPPPPPPPEPEPEPEIRVRAAEGVQDISPVKEDRPIVHVDKDEMGRTVQRQGRAVKLKGMDEAVHIKVGAEGRLMGGIAGHHFDEDYYSGHYVTTTGRTVMVIDARATYGKLILYDSKTGLFRALHPTTINDFVYTYGPEFDQEEPIEGSVTFLPGDGHWIHRFIWLPKDGTAEFPVMVRFEEKDVSFTSRGRTIKGKLILPPDEGPHPAVVWLTGGQCPQPGMRLEFARALALNGVGTLFYDNGSPNEPGQNASAAGPNAPETVIQEALSAVRFLQNHSKVDPDRVGVWGVDCGREAALRTVLLHGHPGFLVVTMDTNQTEAERLAPVLGRINVPLLLIVPEGEDVGHGHLADLIKSLPEVRRIGATVADVNQADEPLMERWDQIRATTRLMARYSPVHARLAAQWILSR